MIIELLSGLVLLVSSYSLYKLRKVHLIVNRVRLEVTDGLDRRIHAEFRQIEALIGLYAELALTRALPSTRGWAASPDFLLELATHALHSRPKTIVECSSGVSTLVLASCMMKNGTGHVYSLENEPKYARITRQNIERHGLEAWATVIDAPLEVQELEARSWYWYAPTALAACPPSIDMLVIDGPPGTTGELARYPAGPALFPRLSDACSVFVDDAIRQDEKEAVRRWLVAFPHLEARDIACEKGCVLIMPRANHHE
jgi:predicted O-methyltransferase YrrM